MRSNRDTLRIIFLLCSVFFTLQVAPRWWSDSLILDEEWEITSSYYYWKMGDVWTPCGTTAPGALCALPLLAMNLKTPAPPANFLRPLWFLFLGNGGHLAAITAWSRSVHWLLGLLVGFILYRFVRDAALGEAVAAMVLWAFEPTLLAYFGTARTDAAAAFWFLLCVAFYVKVRSSPGSVPFVWAGFLAGLTAATRYYGVFLLPILAALEISHWRAQGKGQRGGPNRFFPRMAALFAGAAGALFLCYLPGTFRFPSHRSPYWFYIRYLSSYAGQRAGVSNMGAFFAGKFWEGGSYLQFPFEFFFKNTAPFLAFLLLAVVLGVSGRIRFPDWMWIPPLFFLGAFYVIDKSMGMHHALVVYPFLVLLAAKAFQWAWERSRESSSSWVRVFPFLLLAWHPLSAVCHFPHYLAYANDFITPEQEAGLLNSIDWDLGQDMKRLAEMGREKGWKKVKLMTYQRTDPAFYGLPWGPWTYRDLSFPAPGDVYVLDPDIARDDPSYSKMISQSPWVDHLPATGNIGGTLYYWEFPAGPVAPDRSLKINSFPYYPDGIPPYPPLPGADHE